MLGCHFLKFLKILINNNRRQCIFKIEKLQRVRISILIQHYFFVFY